MRGGGVHHIYRVLLFWGDGKEGRGAAEGGRVGREVGGWFWGVESI